MKLISYKDGGRASYGLVEGETVHDLGGLPNAPTDLKAAIAAGMLVDLAARDAARLPRADIELLPIVPNPGKILCVGHNYEDHRKETNRAKTAHPSIFVRFADTQVAAGAAIRRPQESASLDYEGELLLVIGKGGRRIAPETAMDHVAGFACANDASVRDWQWHTTQFTPGKNFPGTLATGPWLVTADEMGDIGGHAITTRLNGVVVQQAGFTDLIFPIPEIIAYCSTFTTLSPGDLILTGTPGGVGAKREPPLWMKTGDRIEVEIGGIGVLANPVADED